MMQHILNPRVRASAKKFPMLVSTYKRLTKTYSDVRFGKDRLRGFTTINMLRAFPSFAPFSAGSYKAKATLTIQSITQTIPALAMLSERLSARRINITPVQVFFDARPNHHAARALKERFEHYGSDKSTLHDYHLVYATMFESTENVRGVFEVGLGTNNSDVVSHMGWLGRPGGSLRAFRDCLRHAQIYGADVDKRILFDEERIKTFFVDQTDLASFESLEQSVPNGLDLIIDDGLHSPNANIHTLIFGLQKIRVGGWVVIEDIGEAALPIWEVVAALFNGSHKTHLIQSRSAYIFAVQRLS